MSKKKLTDDEIEDLIGDALDELAPEYDAYQDEVDKVVKKYRAKGLDDEAIYEVMNRLSD